MSEGLALGRITQPSSQLHNRTITLGYRLRHFAQPHTYDSRKIWWGAANVTGYLHHFCVAGRLILRPRRKVARSLGVSCMNAHVVQNALACSE